MNRFILYLISVIYFSLNINEFLFKLNLKKTLNQFEIKIKYLDIDLFKSVLTGMLTFRMSRHIHLVFKEMDHTNEKVLSVMID